MDDEVIIYLGLLVIIIAIIIGVIVYIVMPIIGVLIGIGFVITASVAVWGLISGAFVGLKNFFEVLSEAHHNL